MKINLVLLIAFATLLGACSTSLPYSKNIRLSHALLQEVVKAYDYQPDSTPIFVAPVFQHRTQILIRPEFGNEKVNYGELFKEGEKGVQFPMQLPEKLKSRVRLYDGKANLTKSKETYLFCSPLLKTKERHIYVMQIFTAYTLRDGEEEIRFVERYFKKYRIRNGKAIFLERIQSDNDWFNP